MIDRIIDISTVGAKLSVKNKLLQIKTEKSTQAICFDDIAALIVSHPNVVYTQAVLSHLAESGGAFICCDGKKQPNGMLLPTATNYVHSERLALQVQMTLPSKKRLWQQLVKAKIQNQSSLLKKLHGDDFGIGAMANRVKSGDINNMESQAAKKYWVTLFQIPDFRRLKSDHLQNSLLDYGYAITRSFLGRYICGSGLNPSLGIHHHNRYDPFCLINDFIEPFRPSVDQAVIDTLKSNTEPKELSPLLKQEIVVRLLSCRYKILKEWRMLGDSCRKLAESYVRILAGTGSKLLLPSNWKFGDNELVGV